MNTNPIDAHLGNRLRMARHARGFSQTDLAGRMGVTFQQIQKYEKGKNRIAASRLHEIARILNVPVESFFEGLDGGENGTAAAFAVDELTALYSRLSPQFGAREFFEFNRAFLGIADPDVRDGIRTLISGIAGQAA